MWLEQSWAAVQQEFSDLGDAADITRVCVRLLVALALGALLGYERESVCVAAGLGLEATAVLSALLAWVVLALLRTSKRRPSKADARPKAGAWRRAR
jgi:uncharacterized membrane protein YhiD involved in acid resistance